MSLLGIDVGTTGTKAVAFSLEGEIITSAYREYPLLEPRPGWLELDPYQVTSAIKEVISEVAHRTKRDPIRALAVSAQGEAGVPLSRDGQILYNSPISFDARTRETAIWWKELISPEETFHISGMALHPMHTILKLIWLKENEPKVFGRLYKFLCFEEYTYYLLGTDPVTDYSLAARTMAFDIRQKEWSKKLLEVAGIDEEILPEVKPSGTVIGRVSRGVAEELGLPNRVEVVTGGHDQPCNALGSGIITGRMAAWGTGTTDCITPAFDRPIPSEGMFRNNFSCYPHVVPGLYTTVAFNYTGGSLLRWYRDNFAMEETLLANKRGVDPYEIILEKLPEKPSSVMILPHFTISGTPYFDTKTKGAMLGLTLGTRREEIVKAILEGTTFEMKLNVELLEGSGVPIDNMRATGGGAKSVEWIQLKADITGKPVSSLYVSEAGALGTAILAGVAIGAYDSIDSAVRNLVKVKRTFEPDREKNKIYEEKFHIYKQIYPAIREISYRL
ncbi:MAG TPA: hypothetical protein EYP53_07410 [Candidatus Latescibacteria bacterium]|nr:hypothetical protein [Candidatus Latescibacterota bacterium]